MSQLVQTPGPGSHLLRCQGDVLAFTLTAPTDHNVKAFLRTNIGHARTQRQEIIDHTESGRAILHRDWHDYPMHRRDDDLFELVLPLTEVGRFEAKTLLLQDGKNNPLWPTGSNTVIKVEPADTCCANTIYSAFVRQFGEVKHACPPAGLAEATALLDSNGYTVIPRSGTFRDLAAELDFIIGTLKCRILQLLPIHPTPTVYGRMGRFGSPFAALDYKAIDPALAEFDRKTTPLQQFEELLNAVHARGGRLFLDIPANHTGWASRLQINHPEWFARKNDATFESPGAWGVTWEDLSKLDYSNVALWQYMAKVFLYWCRIGVDGFRCDAGYMLPCEAWAYIVAKVRNEFPDTIFLLEGLGGKIETMNRLLTEANLDWAYSELFQNYDRGQIESYLPAALETSSARGILVNFAETHDNNRLAATSQRYAMLRTALTALFSQNGAFGFSNGVEWFATEKIDVHETTSLNWGSRTNQIGHLVSINTLLENHPCFHAGAQTRLVHEGSGNGVAMERVSADGRDRVIVAANLDLEQPLHLAWRMPTDMLPEDNRMFDLLEGQWVTISPTPNGGRCELQPGSVVCLASAPRVGDHTDSIEPRRVAHQRLRAKALAVLHHFHPGRSLANEDPDTMASALAADPLAFCRSVAQPRTGAPDAKQWAPVVRWAWPEDRKRVVMVPPEHFLLVCADHPFRAHLLREDTCLRAEASLQAADGTHFILVTPVSGVLENQRLTLSLRVRHDSTMARSEAELLYLAPWQRAMIRRRFTAEETLESDLYAVCTNGRGAMSQVRGAWGEVRSQYDALLAANLDPNVPVDRHVLFTRCRAWIVYQGYSQPLDRTCLVSFGQPARNQTAWRFKVPVGSGAQVTLDVHLTLLENRNAIVLAFHRRSRTRHRDHLADEAPIEIILRPDIDDRQNHAGTKAYLGAEFQWPPSVSPAADGFRFQPPSGHVLEVRAADATFTLEPEWHYMVRHPIEAERGLDDSTDHFSPGYFRGSLQANTCLVLKAGTPAVPEELKTEQLPETRVPEKRGTAAETNHAMAAYIVARDEGRTVIAGYPWFLDWGRDTLICLRGMIAAGRLTAARDILLQFARFEDRGTLPNVIRGNDISNRDTSDAPLWFLTACRDLTRAEDSLAFLDSDCGGRTVRDVLVSIVKGYLTGTPNGITVDTATGLVFSPSHFTWMDTNYPAGTPREGYPVEIQALWFAALSFLAELGVPGDWQGLAQQVRDSLHHYYVPGGLEHLSDCLHGPPGTPAGCAVPDNALRPNQLLTITLGAVTDPALCRAILDACQRLIIPGGIRSLADRPVAPPLRIEHNGNLLNDPDRPYRGQYRGDEDTCRKPAYHNGTAWTWPFPSFCEALVRVHGQAALQAALAMLASTVETVNAGCIGQVPEILDGDAPHMQRGCGAQAWGVTEFYRVLKALAPKA